MEILTEKNATEKTDKEPCQVTTTLTHPLGILGLPVELLKKIIYRLPFTAIPKVMVNRFFRPICEECLYERIYLPNHPRRTLRLLETFTIRPELALLVRHLDIDAYCLNGWRQESNEIPGVLKLDGVQALSLAKSIISIDLRTFGDWMDAPAYAALRDVISNLTLQRLTIPYFCDLTTEQEGWDRGAVAAIGAVIRAQPRLKHLDLLLYNMSDQLSSTLQASLLPSDVPNLKSLECHPKSAIPFLAVVSGLESLSLFGDKWNEELFSQFEVSSATSRSSLRCLAITLSHDDEWVWANLVKILALFPNIEVLCLTVDALRIRSAQPAEHFFRKIENHAHILQSLQNIEVQYDSFRKDLSEVAIESMVAFKQRCPLLRAIITPQKEIWQFHQTRTDDVDPVPKFVGTIWRGWPGEKLDDLPSLNDVSGTMNDG